MQVLLDECLPRRLAASLRGHQVSTVSERGWGGRQNGELLELMIKAGLDAFLTIDQNLVAEQRVGNPPLLLIVLHAPSNRLPDVAPLAPAVLAAMENTSPRVVDIGN